MYWLSAEFLGDVALHSVQGRYHAKLNRLTEVVARDTSAIF